ncbi:MAG: response regulator [candidate division KSB1 bacterium]|nr:response regulator [candidate division KSB1 bacterium]MDZ7296327.1 response regulator [candidate division KSB1 bacterium]MDZ7338418.1 response regulator [candidate division KSB1 bacterium]MDZ7385099.1 response regulator [candidate division KSB1 bacterium]MDZ7391642.1 response regulator [candidate division KSB1 bacterium]
MTATTNILIVDDEQDILDVLPQVMKRWGYNPIVAKDGREGLQKYQEYPIDAVVTDMKMPEMDGLQLLKEIMSLDRHAVVILLTAYPSLDSAIRAMREGAYDYLVKPVNLEELKLRIERGLERKSQLKAIPMLRGLNWALIVSIPLWLILGIILAKLLR